MAKRKRLSDLAAYLDISEATVSLAMNGRDGVSSKTREKVMQAAKELGYRPNHFARGLASRKSRSIGLIVPESENPFYSKMMQLMDAFVRSKGYSLVIGFSNFALESEQETIDRFVDLSVEGIVISPIHGYATSAAYRKRIVQHDVPIVYLGSHYDFESHYIMTDLAKGTEKLTAYLLAQGVRDILFFTGSLEIVLARERERGFRQAFESYGLHSPEDCYVRCAQLGFDEAYQQASERLSREPVPQAIITINDIMALGVMRAARHLGYNIPRDILIAGYDNVIYSEIAEVPLTTVHQPLDQLVETAVEQLLELIDQPEREAWIQLKIEPELVVRESTTKQA